MAMEAPADLGLAAGGQIEQKIYPDEYGIDTWDPTNRGELFVHIVNSEQYQALTGEAPPPSPISAQTYTDWGLPWFALYDERKGAVPAAEPLSGVKSVRQQDQERGLPEQPEDASVEIDPEQIARLHLKERRGNTSS
jgi:hypothetical protein